MTEFIWWVRILLAKEIMRSEKKQQKFKKAIFFHSLDIHLTFTWHPLFASGTFVEVKAEEKKKFKSEKKFSKLKKLEHCIYFETLYLFRGIVLILRHCIHFKTLYLFRDIIFISRHCIYLETLYSFRDIVFISRHCIYFETLYLFWDIVFI